jgi:hypothetical protein
MPFANRIADLWGADSRSSCKPKRSAIRLEGSKVERTPADAALRRPRGEFTDAEQEFAPEDAA